MGEQDDLDFAIRVLGDAISTMQDAEVSPKHAHAAIMQVAAASALTFHDGDADRARQDFDRAVSLAGGAR